MRKRVGSVRGESAVGNGQWAVGSRQSAVKKKTFESGPYCFRGCAILATGACPRRWFDDLRLLASVFTAHCRLLPWQLLAGFGSPGRKWEVIFRVFQVLFAVFSEGGADTPVSRHFHLLSLRAGSVNDGPTTSDRCLPSPLSSLPTADCRLCPPDTEDAQTEVRVTFCQLLESVTRHFPLKTRPFRSNSVSPCDSPIPPTWTSLS